ncbi:MAG: hypothetical protein AAFV33_21830 [Chloroflexota bacterium]
MVDASPAVKNGAENVIWDLSVFYSGIDDPQIDTDMDALEKDVVAFAEQYRGRAACHSRSKNTVCCSRWLLNCITFCTSAPIASSAESVA